MVLPSSPSRSLSLPPFLTDWPQRTTPSLALPRTALYSAQTRVHRLDFEHLGWGWGEGVKALPSRMSYDVVRIPLKSRIKFGRATDASTKPRTPFPSLREPVVRVKSLYKSRSFYSGCSVLFSINQETWEKTKEFLSKDKSEVRRQDRYRENR